MWHMKRMKRLPGVTAERSRSWKSFSGPEWSGNSLVREWGEHKLMNAFPNLTQTPVMGKI